jgi:hypothetical protein
MKSNKKHTLRQFYKVYGGNNLSNQNVSFFTILQI